MNKYSKPTSITISGQFVGYLHGGYVFHLENEDIIDFDQINPKSAGRIRFEIQCA